VPRTPCTPEDDRPCTSYGPGHHLHVINAKFAGRTPWGWHDGVVTDIHDGDVVTRYVESGHRVRVWHHAPLPGLEVGVPVRVHEQYAVLGGAFGWAKVAVDDGLGPVPEPEQPELWAAETSVAVVNLGTGLGLPMDGPR
jgi:hypothetical protein